MIDFNAVRARHSLVEVAARYTELRKQGNEYVGRCLFHNDSDPSMTIFRGRDGVQRYRCFACGATGDVLDFLCEIESIDKVEAVKRLDGEQLPAPNLRPPRELPPDESECWEPVLPVPDDAPAYEPARTFNPKRGREVSYARATLITPYRDAQDRLLGHIVRLEFEDGKKLCPVVTYCIGPGGVRRWCAKRMRPPYPLVGVEELAKRQTASVLVVEGEKKREAARKALPGFVVVSLLGGAEAVAKNDLRPLAGRQVTLWPDADVVGRRAMREVGAALEPTGGDA